MQQTLELKVYPNKINDFDFIKDICRKKLKSQWGDFDFQIRKKSIDARQKRPFFLLKVVVFTKDDVPRDSFQLNIQTKLQKRCIIVGAGPAGYFAALQCLKNGIKPIIIERGKDVQSRRKDLRAIQQEGIVNPNSNYCFGEGGAGTYSDGKLYTRSHKRGSIEEVLKILVHHGASTDILADAHPHIGSNKLPKIIANIRETITNNGGEIHFNSLLTDILITQNVFMAVVINHKIQIAGDACILATGHSARDIYTLLHEKNIKLERKDFALGVRIEHPQPLIDEIQYNQRYREENLPAASYKVVCQVGGQGVFSFCMCPGGLIVPSATAPGEIVVNGMSLSRRDSPFANSGFVTSISSDYLEYLGYDGIFGNLNFQKEVEQTLFKYGDGSQKAPALTMTDFVSKKSNHILNNCSYIPGIYNAPLYDLLPKFVYGKLSQAMTDIGQKMKGFYTAEANVVATESRTSSPVRIPRDPATMMHPQINFLFPCGEGAGYAGGILSAAMDGQNTANAVAEAMGIKSN